MSLERFFVRNPAGPSQLSLEARSRINISTVEANVINHELSQQHAVQARDGKKQRDLARYGY